MRLTLESDKREVEPGETAIFGFLVEAADVLPSYGDVEVTSANPRFDRRWCHVVAGPETPEGARKYSLQIRPEGGSHQPYGRFPLRVGVPDAADGRTVDADCLLLVRPCVHLGGPPRIHLSSRGELSISIPLVNCGHADLSVEVTLSHRKSGHSAQWTFGLHAEDEEFEAVCELTGFPRRGSRLGHIDLEVSAEGVPVLSAHASALSGRLPRLKRLLPDPTKVVTAAMGLVVGALATIGVAHATTTGRNAGMTQTTPLTTIGTSTTSTTPTKLPGITVPTSVACGSVAVGSQTVCTILVESTGAGPLTVDPVEVAPSSFSVAVNTCGGALPRGSSCAITVEFRPTAPGSVTGTATIHQNLPGAPSYVRLTGEGLPALNNSDNGAARANLQTALAMGEAYAGNYGTYTGWDPTTFSATSTALRSVTGSTPSTGVSFISVYVSTDGRDAVMTAWAPSSQTCWAIVATAPLRVIALSAATWFASDESAAVAGLLFVETPDGPQSACAGANYYLPPFPAGSVSSTAGFPSA